MKPSLKILFSLVLPMLLLASVALGFSACGQKPYNPEPLVPDFTTDGGLGLKKIGDGYTIVSYTGGANLSIPTEYNGVAITAIGEAAFSGAPITALVLPENITAVGSYAFSGCTGLKSVEIKNAAVSLGASVFRNCKALETAVLPNLTKIPDALFYDCASLSGFVIPETVTEIGGASFYGCLGLLKIDFPEATKKIGQAAFEKSGLQKLNIPDTVNSVGRRAFAESKIAAVTLGKNLKADELSHDVFANCAALSKIVIPHKKVNVTLKLSDSSPNAPVTQLIWFYKTEVLLGIALPDDAFGANVFLRSIILPENIAVIGSGAFSGCYNLEAITLPSGLTKISATAFENCSALNGVVLPNKLTSIESKAFSGCKALTAVSFPQSLEKIAERAFNACENLKDIAFTSGIKTVEANAFKDTAWYAAFDDNSIVYIEHILYNFKAKVYPTGYEGEKPTFVIDNISPGTRTIAPNAFEGVSCVTAVIIPDGVTEIGKEAFAYMPKLSSVTIAGSVKSIGARAFSGGGTSTENMTFTLSEGIERISLNAFSDCFIKQIEIPYSVTFIGEKTFENVYCYIDSTTTGKTTIIMNRAFDDKGVTYGLNWSGAGTNAATVQWK